MSGGATAPKPGSTATAQPPDAGSRALFDEASLQWEGETPGQTLSQSTGIGWTSVLLSQFRSASGDAAFQTAQTTDHRLSILTKGELDVELREGAGWRRLRIRPGPALLVPGGHARKLRWSDGRSPHRAELAHLVIPQASSSARNGGSRPPRPAARATSQTRRSYTAPPSPR